MTTMSTDSSDSTDSRGHEDGSNSFGDAIMRVLRAIRGSFFLFILAFGIIVEVAAITVFQNSATGALLGIIGVSAILYALGGIAVSRLIGYS